LPADLSEVKFKDPITFGYYYEQIKTDFMQCVAPDLTRAELVPVLLDLGCLEMRRSFQNMSANILDKKINFEYLEKEVGLRRFFADLVLKQKVYTPKRRRI
jgi:focal adhesion kinase 1